MTYEEYRAAVITKAKQLYPGELTIAVGYIGEAFSGHVTVEDAAKQVVSDSEAYENQS